MIRLGYTVSEIGDRDYGQSEFFLTDDDAEREHKMRHLPRKSFYIGGVHMDLERERKRLLQRDAEWALVSSEGGDVGRILSFWTDDARVYPPGLPMVQGKAALRSYVEGALGIPGFHITWSSSDATLSPDGEWGYLLSTNAVTLPGPGGQLVTTRGRAVTIWRREADGQWRCAIDIWNDEPATP